MRGRPHCSLDIAPKTPSIILCWPAGRETLCICHLQYAAVLAATDAEGVQSAWAAQRAGDEERLSSAARLSAVALVRDECGRRLDALLAGAPGGERGHGQRLTQLAGEVRVRERRILERAKFLLTQQHRQLRSLALTG